MNRIGTIDVFDEKTKIKIGDMLVVSTTKSDLEFILQAIETGNFSLSPSRQNRLINEIKGILNEED